MSTTETTPTTPAAQAIPATNDDSFEIDPITSRGFGSLSVATILSDPAHRHPERPAIIMGDTVTTYGELWAQAMAYAGALRARGIGRGDRVAMIVPNVTDFPRVYYAILSLGAIAVPVHLLLKADEIEYVLRDSQSTAAQGIPGAEAVAISRNVKTRLGKASGRMGCACVPFDPQNDIRNSHRV